MIQDAQGAQKVRTLLEDDVELSLDINSGGARVSLEVANWSAASVQATASPWATAVIVWEWSINGTDWLGFPVAQEQTGPGAIAYLSLKGVRYISARVATPEGSASTATLSLLLDTTRGSDIGDASSISGLSASELLDAGVNTYTPATPGDWNPAPSFVGPALDQLAARRVYDAIVDIAGAGDYTSIVAAIAGGAKQIFVRSGMYVETSDIVLTEDMALIGESSGSVTVILAAGSKVRIDGTGRATTAGTITYSNGSTTVNGTGTSFTTLLPGDWINLRGIYHTIGSITSDTVLDLATSFKGNPTPFLPLAIGMEGRSMASGVTLIGIVFAGAAASAIEIEQGIHVVVRECLVASSGAAGVPVISVLNSSGVLLLGNVVQDCLGPGIQVTSSKGIRLETNVVKNCEEEGYIFDGTTQLVACDACYSANNGIGYSLQGTAADVALTDCNAVQCETIGIQSLGTIQRAHYGSCSVCNNGTDGLNLAGIDEVVDGCVVKGNLGRGIVPSGSCIITDNKLGLNHGIQIDGTGKASCICSGNSILTNAGAVSTELIAGTSWSVCNNLIASANNAGSIGINVLGANSIVSNNRLTGTGSSGTGVRVAGANCVVNGNNAKTYANGLLVIAGATLGINTSNHWQGNTTPVTNPEAGSWQTANNQ